MDRSWNCNCVQGGARFSRMAQENRKLVFERARRIMELPLEYVANEQFERWSRDRKTENEVLGPMPACNGSPGKAQPPSDVAPYVASLYEVPLLTREQEVHLFRKMNYLKYKASRLREGLEPSRPQQALMARIEKLYEELVATRNHIVCANLRLVVSIAKRHVGEAQDIFELVSDGNVSLMRAVERFDYSLGNRFSTYATWAIIRNFARTIPEVLRRRGRFRTDHSEFFTATSDVRTNQYELEALQDGREKLLERILRRLSNREREILVCRFGLRRGSEPQTLRQVGDAMGVSKERIRQIEARALERLRKIVVQERPRGSAGGSVSWRSKRPDNGVDGRALP